MPPSLNTARKALDLAGAAEQLSPVTICLIEAIEALIEHQAALERRLTALVPLPVDAVSRHGSFGIDIS